MSTNVTTAHGKVILTGEHSVVYGFPALVAGCSLEVVLEPQSSSSLIKDQHTAFFENLCQIFSKHYSVAVSQTSWQITGDLPLGCGLGSSAALAHAVFKYFFQESDLRYSADEMVKLIHESEVFAHGQSSGIDATGTVIGGLLCFQKMGDKLKYGSVKNSTFSQIPFVLINSGKPKETTKEMVTWVAEQRLHNPKIQETLEKIGSRTAEWLAVMQKNEFDPSLITTSQKALEDLGVVSKKAFNIISEIEKVGGWAKVTGAGGIKEGSGMILAYHLQVEQLLTLCKKRNWEHYQTFLGTT